MALVPVDRKCIAVTKTFEILSKYNGKRVFYPGEPFIVLPDQFEWFKANHAGYVLNLTPRLLTPIEALVPITFGATLNEHLRPQA
jgi:hypothetical protein